MKFPNLESLYSYLEKHAQDFASYFEIGQLFDKLAGVLKTVGNEIDFEKAKWETEFFFLMISNGNVKPLAQMKDDKGGCHDIPDLKKFDERQWSYLVERFDLVTNPVLKARYAHLLWCSPKRHGKYARTAVDNYLTLVKIFEEADKEKHGEQFGLDVLDSIKRAYSLAIIINYKFDEIKSEIMRLVTSYFPESSSCPPLRSQLLKLILEDKKIFSKEDLTGFTPLCEEIASLWISRDNIRPAIELYEFAERWEMRNSGSNSGIWRRKIAESYETMMRNGLEKGNIAVALSFCNKAIQNYQIIKDDEKLKELEQIFQQNKDKIEYIEFSQEIDLTEHIQYCKDLAKDLVQNNSPEQIIGFLASDEKYLLPKMQNITERAKKLNESSLVHQIIPITTIDQQSNPAQTFTSDEARYNHSVLEQYRMELEVNNRILIREIMFLAICEGKLTTINIVEFLKKSSWAGKSYSKKMGNREISYSWVNLVTPAIDDFFYQIKSYLDDNKKIPNPILCIDSLTLKIEGLLRDFFALQGITTSTFKREEIVREKDLNELLADPKMQELFTEDELRFLKFLLVEQMGYNLRHRIAHSLMISQEYGIDLMNYLIIAMLRICQYNFNIKQMPVEDTK
jgi:hypothetical protein